MPAVLTLAITLILATTATLTGRVADSIGKPMRGVDVQAINVETGLAWTTRTNDEGFYIIGNLPPGLYRLVLRQMGFRTIVKPGLELQVQDIFALNFEMQIGSPETSVS